MNMEIYENPCEDDSKFIASQHNAKTQTVDTTFQVNEKKMQITQQF